MTRNKLVAIAVCAPLIGCAHPPTKDDTPPWLWSIITTDFSMRGTAFPIHGSSTRSHGSSKSCHTANACAKIDYALPTESQLLNGGTSPHPLP